MHIFHIKTLTCLNFGFSIITHHLLLPYYSITYLFAILHNIERQFCLSIECRHMWYIFFDRHAIIIIIFVFCVFVYGIMTNYCLLRVSMTSKAAIWEMVYFTWSAWLKACQNIIINVRHFVIKFHVLRVFWHFTWHWNIFNYFTNQCIDIFFAKTLLRNE